MADKDLEARFGRAFERFYTALEDQVELLREALPAVLREHERWNDVAQLAPDLKISVANVDSFVDTWQTEFGTREFRAIFPPATEIPDEPDAEGEPGHESMAQPEKDASYTTAVMEFIYKHGSFLDLQRAMRRYWRSSRHVLTIASSSLVFAVGALEATVADIERIRLRRHIGAARTSEKEFSLDDLIRLGDIEAVIEETVERRVEALCYGSLDDWDVWFERSFRVPLHDLALNWQAVREVVQRRHVIAHNSGMASRLYLQRSGVSGVEVGDFLAPSPQYLYTALDEIAVLGIRMLLLAWKKLGGQPEHITVHVRSRSYDGLVSERWNTAHAMAEELLRLLPSGSEDSLIARINAWLARQGLGEDITPELEAWDVGPLTPRYRIARAAMLRDYEYLEQSIPKAVAAGELHRAELLSWPLFRGLRSQPVFASIIATIDRSSAG